MWGAGNILYTLLMGEPPFNEQSIPKLIKKVQNADYDRESNLWMNLSEEAKSLILGLLEVDPI
jgi:serine/threonine protein kinase